jgi:serine/threonine protein kinase
VFKAKVYNVEVAVKKMTDMEGMEESKKKSEEKQFAAEMGLLMEVFHPNICRLLGYSNDGSQRCLVLEMCMGGSLYDALQEDRRLLEEGKTPVLTWQKRLQIAVAIARALVHLHTLPKPMIHRDVKTQNVST